MTMMFQIPTPTPFPVPDSSPILQLPDVSVWQYAPETVGWFNSLGVIADGARIAFFILCIIAAFIYVSALIRRISSDDS